MHPSSDKMKCTPFSGANDVIEKLFKSLRSKYQENLETLMKESDFIFKQQQNPKIQTISVPNTQQLLH